MIINIVKVSYLRSMKREITTTAGTLVRRLAYARCNVFLIGNPGHIIMIDTGMAPDRMYIKRTISRSGLNPEAVILTHTHFDHASNAAWIKREFNSKVIVHEAEAGHLSNGDTPIPAGTLAFTRGLVSIGRRLPSWFEYEKCHPDQTFTDRLSLDGFGFSCDLMHTPGHCPGEIAIVIDNEIVIAGDSLMGVFPGKIFPVFADDESELINSW